MRPFNILNRIMKSGFGTTVETLGKLAQFCLLGGLRDIKEFFTVHWVDNDFHFFRSFPFSIHFEFKNIKMVKFNAMYRNSEPCMDFLETSLQK